MKIKVQSINHLAALITRIRATLGISQTAMAKGLNIKQSVLNQNVGNICATLQNPDSDLFTTKKEYICGPFIFRFSRESYNVLFINPHTITHIFTEELK